MSLTRSLIVQVTLGLVAFLPGCSETTREHPPIEMLAQTASIRIGHHLLHLPIVALNRVEQICQKPSAWPCGPSIDELARSASQGRPLSASSITITFHDYAIFKDSARDEWIAIPELCDKLQQHWARRQCASRDLFRDNLRRFTLILPSALADTNSLGTINGQKETVNSVVQRMRLVGDAPTLHCATDGKGLCTATMKISKEVIAVWILDYSDTEPRALRRQAAAIRAFVVYAAGERESYQDLIEALNRSS